jgi:hypothetical protein
MHAAYQRGPATSAASSSKDSVPTTLPQLLRSSCLHAPPPLGSPLASPHHPLPPRAQPPQPATRSIIRTRPAFASTPSHRSCRRCTQLTSEAQRRQLRHPSETRCKRRCPSCSDVIACTHHHPSQTSTHPLQPRAQPPQPETRHFISAFKVAGVCKHPLTAQAWSTHAAYHRGSATSAASSVRGSVPATLPQLLRCDCLHAPPPTRLAPRRTPAPAAASRATAPAQNT